MTFKNAVEQGKTRKPVADYVLDRDDDEDWEHWLQTHRIELNAMTTPEFIAWLDRKMAAHGIGKLVPPAGVVEQELEERLAEELRAQITERILREADLDGQVTQALRTISRPSAGALLNGIRRMFEQVPEHEWRDHIAAVVAELLN